jgi:hypothetical protein
MTQPAIMDKLRRELELDITTERQVVYILVEIRKAIEQAGEQKNYFALDFYCSWALHTKMDRAGAIRILKRFDQAHPLLVQKKALPPELRKEIHETTKLKKFEDEMEQFLKANGLPTGIVDDANSWVKFLRLYAHVIDDCALVVSGERTKLRSLDHISVHLQMALKKLEGETVFRIRWTCHGKDGQRGSHDVYFTIPEEPVAAA